MSLGAKIAARRQTKRVCVLVPEWGEDTPLELYSGPLTCYDLDRIQKKHKDFLSTQSIEGMVDLIIMKAEDKAGERLFTLEDKPHLMRESLAVVSRVSAEMLQSVSSIEEHEKN